MKTVLNRGNLDTFSPAQRHVIRHAEIVAHNSALAIYHELRIVLPRDIRDRALPVALVGLTSALGRLLAICDDQKSATEFAIGLGDIMPSEVAYWRGAKKLH